MNMFNSKKGFYASARDWISFFVGLFLLSISLIPLLKYFKVIPFGLPAFMNGLIASIFFWIIALAGVYIVIDGFIEPAGHALHIALMVAGLIFIIAGLIPILYSFKIIPFTLDFLKNLVVYNIIIVIESIMLMVAGFTMR